MFLPNNLGLLTHRTGTDGYAQPTYTTATYVQCAVVHLKGSTAKTSVRTDSSASRGNAEEKVSVAKLLFPNDVAIALGDKFEINAIVLRVVMIEPRYSVFGDLDHYEVDFEAWTR